jgi:CDP-glucose 4,6-dehydratase
MDVYKNSRILVTGHTGFKGAWLVQMLRVLGAEVFGVSTDIGQTPPYIKNVFDFEHEFETDIRERNQIENTIKSIRPDLIFHLAAQSLVIESYNTPLDTFDINVIGTMNVLNAITPSTNTRGIIVVTTDKVYLNDESGKAFHENDPLGGLDPYSASKSCASILLSAWRELPNLENTQIIDVRAGNVIGGGDRAANRLLPDLLQAASEERVALIRNPESIRPWQHVLDPLFGYLLVGEKILNRKKISNSYNFGPSKEHDLTVTQVSQIFKNEFQNMDFQSYPSVERTVKESELLRLDSGRSLSELQWSSILTPIEAIKITIEWEKVVKSGTKSPNSITEQQVSQYLETAIKMNHKPQEE